MPLVPVTIYSKKDDEDWREEFSLLSFQPESFAEGYYKRAYKATNCKLLDAKNVEFVLKLGKGAPLSREVAERDVEMQLECAQLAKKYNDLSVTPKKIDVVEPYLVRILYGCHAGHFGILERRLVGKYEKHNTSVYPGVELTDRNTPAAFTHFTWEATGLKKIVCDLQGVGDTLTDPQVIDVHTNGDHAVTAMIKFLTTHRCNNICKALCLRPLNPHDLPESLVRTQPVPTGTLSEDWLVRVQENIDMVDKRSEGCDSGLGDSRPSINFQER